MSKEKTNRARQFSARALKRIITAGRNTPSLYPKIAQEMSRKSGDTFHRQEVAAWLHEDATQRIEPRLGAGLLLIEVGNALTGKKWKPMIKYKSGDTIKHGKETTVIQ